MQTVPNLDLPSFLGTGEKEAIQLATATNAQLLFMDDRQGVRAAVERGLAVIGTIGILNKAAQGGFLDLDKTFARLRKTTFRCPEQIMKTLLQKLQ